MIYVFHGDDTFSAQEALRDLYRAVGPRDLWESNVTQLDGVSFNLALLMAASQVVPFLAERRLVIVRGLLATAEPQRQTSRRGRGAAAARIAASPAPGLADALQKLPPTSDVAFVDGRLSRDNSLFKELAPTAQVQEFPALRREALSRWVRDRMVQKGGDISGQAVAELVDLVGSNLWAMDTELEKLATYCRDRPADVEDIRTLVSSARETNVFALVDAIMERRTDDAFRLTERLMETGSTGPYLLGMIGRQARLVALAQALAQEKVPQAEWDGRLGIAQEFVLRKTIEQARRFSSDQVRQLYRLLVETDVAMKTGVVSEELAMTELLARAGAVQRAPRPVAR